MAINLSEFIKYRAHEIASISNALKTIEDNGMVIEVKGGVVQHIHNLRNDQSYYVLDWDDIEAG